MMFIYPRLPAAASHKLLGEIGEVYSSDGLDGLRRLVGFDHPEAAPVATGGHVADADKVASVRGAVIKVLGRWLEPGVLPKGEVSAFDAALGSALHPALAIVPGDAAHAEVWNFLSLVVMPDVAVLRFPDMHRSRMLGSKRNALRRAWLRQEILGDLMQTTERPLGEDELVGLLERTSLSRNRELVRSLARLVLEYRGRDRSHWARDLYKRVTFATGPRLLDALSPAELDALVRGEESPTDARSSGTPALEGGEGSRFEHDSALRVVDPDVSRDAEIGRRFTADVVERYSRAKIELGYNAKQLLHLVDELGGIGAAQRIVGADRPSDGFIRLWENRRLDLSLEALVLSPEYEELFDESILSKAERRLGEFRYRRL